MTQNITFWEKTRLTLSAALLINDLVSGISGEFSGVYHVVVLTGLVF